MTDKTPLMIVDDDLGMLETLTDILEEYGYRVTTAANGRTAVEKCRNSDCRLVLMDIRMEGMDGVQAMKEIKKDRPEVNVVLMTAYTHDEIIYDGYCGGARCVIRKPFKMDQLFPILSSAGRRLKILVVDDDESMASLLERVLSRSGHDVSIARCGKEAMELVGSGEFNAAFIDMVLPDMNGCEIYKILTADHPGVKVVLMSGFGERMKEQMEQALEENACACLYKPFGLGEFQSIVADICRENVT